MPGTVLVTGVLGCLGAWTALLAARDGWRVIGYDLGHDDRRLKAIASPKEREAIEIVRGDVTDLDQLARTLGRYAVTHVVHLAALQVPFCRADPPLGARVNVVGTVNVFEAAKRRGLQTTVAYASSAAVYDEQGRILPRTLYGVYKLANEGTARVYWQDERVASIGLRPFSVYGPGRDQGVTADPTHAMRAAARRQPYRIGFGGKTELHYAPDVAHAFLLAAQAEPTGAFVYDFPGEPVSMAEVVAAIEAAAPEAAGLVTFEERALPFPERLPGERFPCPVTPLAQGIEETVEHFRREAEDGG
ncbi:MAG: epimerase [Thermoleophilia bacterium]